MTANLWEGQFLKEDNTTLFKEIFLEFFDRRSSVIELKWEIVARLIVDGGQLQFLCPENEFRINAELLIGQMGVPACSDRIVWTYVLEGRDGQVTDFFSFYSLPYAVSYKGSNHSGLMQWTDP